MVEESSQRPLFDDLPERDRSPMRARWWIFAVAVHLGLLWVPIAWYEARSPSPDAGPVTVTIVSPPPVAEDPEPVDPVVPPSPEVAPDPVPETPAQRTRAQPPETPEPDNPPVLAITPPGEEIGEPEPAPAEPVPLDVQRLLETVAAMDWREPEEERRDLGRSTDSEVTEWLRQPVLALEDNTFDGMTAPPEVEITDRWMSPGGEHNVVIRGPDGNTYCGRQGPADDLRPWLQMPMLFHRCAGGGKRGGLSSWRNN